MTMRWPSRMARATRSAAFVRLASSTGLCRSPRLGRRNRRQPSGSATPRPSRIWAMSGLVRSDAASCSAAGDVRGGVDADVVGTGPPADDAGREGDAEVGAIERGTDLGLGLRELQRVPEPVGRLGSERDVLLDAAGLEETLDLGAAEAEA